MIDWLSDSLCQLYSVQQAIRFSTSGVTYYCSSIRWSDPFYFCWNLLIISQQPRNNYKHIMKHLCIYIYIYIYYVTYNSLFALFYLPHCSHWFVDVDIHTPHPAFPHFLFSLPRLSFLKEKEERTEKEKRKILENLFFFFFYSMSTRDQKRKIFFSFHIAKHIIWQIISVK